MPNPRVICISQRKNITLGHVYEVIGNETDSFGIRYVRIIDDDDQIGIYYTHRFRTYTDTSTASGAEEYEEVMAAQEAMHGNAGILLSDE